MTPHMEAIAFRIWQVAEPKGWDLTVADAAREAGIDFRLAGIVVKKRGWQTRFRTTKKDIHWIGQGMTNSGFSPIEMGWI